MSEFKVRWLLNADPPKDKPLEVQMEALRRSYPKEGWGHILDMGMGKTTVALNEFAMAVEDMGYKRMIVIAPNTFKPDWEKEAKEFRFPHEFITFDSSKRHLIKRWLAGQKKTVMGMAVNVEALAQKETMELIRDFCSVGPTYFAFDESILAKNPKGSFFSNAAKVSGMCQMLRILSGKPTTQGAQDLWAQLKLIGALENYNFYAFRNRYCVLGGFKGKQIVGTKNEAELKEYLNKWCFIANNADYSSRPAPRYVVREVPMLAVQQQLYDEMQNDFMVDLGDGKVSSAEMVITRLTKLQQITCGFLIDDDKNVKHLVPLDQNLRIRRIMEMLDNEVQGKIIIGAHHSAAIEMLLEALHAYKPVSIRGATHTDRDTISENKRIFNNDNTCRVLVGQLTATKYGHTLLGDQELMPCFHNVFFENSFSLDTRSQFERRNDRNGQMYGVINVDFASSPMDLRAVTALQRKEDVASAVLGFARERGILSGVQYENSSSS